MQSLNKRHADGPWLDSLLRRDWHSLLSEASHARLGLAADPEGRSPSSVSSSSLRIDGWPEELLFRNWSRDVFPHADRMVE